MQIGILQAGHAPDGIVAKYGDYDAMFRRLLDGQGFTFRTYDVVDMQFPDSPEACDGWLITGSRHGAYEDLPFIKPLEEFIRAAHRAHVPLVGICFGHQIIAQALGGKVEKFGGGWAVGRTAYEGADGPVHLNAWHQDQVVEPPSQATTLTGNDFCRHAALVYPGGIYTVQAHPEMSPTILADFLVMRGEAAGVPKPILKGALERIPLHNDEAAEALRIARHFHEHARVPHG